MGMSFSECHTHFRQVEIRGLATDALEVHGVVGTEVKRTVFFSQCKVLFAGYPKVQDKEANYTTRSVLGEIVNLKI